MLTAFRMVRKISVYEGISPALLATMSLSQGIKGATNQQLIASLKKNNIITNEILKESMQEIDRGQFTSKANPYQNKPYQISNGQNMTDIFTHAVILEKVTSHLLESNKFTSKVRILDIGTGHGYLAFVIAKFIEKAMAQKKLRELEFDIVGIDVGEKCIQVCQQLKGKFFGDNSMGLSFQSSSLQELCSKEAEKFDIMIGGFFVPPNIEKLILQLAPNDKQRFYGIWATESDNGQSLYSHYYQENRKQRVKEQIMATLFSMPILSSSVSKYFIEDSDTQNQPQSQAESVNEEEVRKKLMEIKRERKRQEKEELKQKLKKLIQIYSKKQPSGKLSLLQMKQIPEINEILQKLK